MDVNHFISRLWRRSQVQREGRAVSAAHLVSASVDQIMAASKERNVHSKRGQPPPPSTARDAADMAAGSPSPDQSAGSGEEGGIGSVGPAGRGAGEETSFLEQNNDGSLATGAAIATAGVADLPTMRQVVPGGKRNAPSCRAGRDEMKPSDEVAEEWGNVKGTKARKRDAVRRKKQQRAQHSAVDGHGPAATPRQLLDPNQLHNQHRQHDHPSYSQPDELPPQRLQQQLQRGLSGPKADVDDAAAGSTHEQPLEATISDADSCEGSSDNDNADLEAIMGEDFDAAVAGGAAAGSSGGPLVRAATGSQSRGSQPLVVAVIGEPNVGKSSTVNALLGTHKVSAAFVDKLLELAELQMPLLNSSIKRVATFDRGRLMLVLYCERPAGHT